MNEIVKDYLEKKQAELKNQKEKVKAEKLVELGLFERIYPGDEGYNAEDSSSEWDADRQEHYNKKSIEVTDEEYEEILKVSNEQIKSETEKNKI